MLLVVDVHLSFCGICLENADALFVFECLYLCYVHVLLWLENASVKGKPHLPKPRSVWSLVRGIVVKLV